MKTLKFYLIAISVFTFISCSNTTESVDDQDVDTDTVTTEQAQVQEVDKQELTELTPDVKARNIYKNITVIMSGTMVFIFDDVLRDNAESLYNAFAKNAGGENFLDSIDAEIALLPQNILMELDGMEEKIDSAFIEMKRQNLSIYDKMFNHEFMKEGI